MLPISANSHFNDVEPVVVISLKARRVLNGARVGRDLEMRNEFTAIIEKDCEWYIAYCPEIPGANGQGRTKDEARQSLSEAIALILEDRREDGLKGVPADAIRETVIVG